MWSPEICKYMSVHAFEQIISAVINLVQTASRIAIFLKHIKEQFTASHTARVILLGGNNRPYSLIMDQKKNFLSLDKLNCELTLCEEQWHTTIYSPVPLHS